MKAHRVELEFDDIIEDIRVYGKKTYLDDIDPNKEYYRGYYVNVASNYKKNTIEWENDMINGALDTFDCTKWKHVNNIKY